MCSVVALLQGQKRLERVLNLVFVEYKNITYIYAHILPELFVMITNVGTKSHTGGLNYACSARYDCDILVS